MPGMLDNQDASKVGAVPLGIHISCLTLRLFLMGPALMWPPSLGDACPLTARWSVVTCANTPPVTSSGGVVDGTASIPEWGSLLAMTDAMGAGPMMGGIGRGSLGQEGAGSGRPASPSSQAARSGRAGWGVRECMTR
jgi:hypothetical protein